MRLSRREIIVSAMVASLLFYWGRLRKFFGSGVVRVASRPVAAPVSLAAESVGVVSVYSPLSAIWDRESYPYVDAIDQETVTAMLGHGLRALIGTQDEKDAWQQLFHSYQPGDLIAIKPNLNDLHAEFRGFVASPAVVNAVLHGLINVLKVPVADICLYDCTRKIPDAYRKRISFPVRFVEPWGSSLLRRIQYKVLGNTLSKGDPEHEIKMSNAVRDRQGRPVKCYLPKVITQCQHIVNLPILKSHQFVLASGALKNHYGTVRFSSGITSPVYLHPPIIHESIIDINSHPQIAGKTRLVVMDAIFGRLRKKGGGPDAWKIFDGKDPARLFVSRDPVALDTVTSDFISRELDARGEDALSAEYLQLAVERGLGSVRFRNGGNNISYSEVRV